MLEVITMVMLTLVVYVMFFPVKETGLIENVVGGFFECQSAGDCTDQTRCNGNDYENRTAECVSGSCQYGDWTFTDCEDSYNNCDAACYLDEHCPPPGCDLESCTCYPP